MRFAIETWAPEYSGSPPGDLDQSAGHVDVSVEVPADKWSGIRPAPQAAPDSVLFVDGVRRVDARIWIQDGSHTRPGLCATVAAGAVRCQAGEATVAGAAVDRAVYAPSISGAGPVMTRAGTYQFMPCGGEALEDLYRGIHKQMTNLELRFAGESEDLVILDGPLRGRTQEPAVGYIKTQHVQYLPDEQHRLLADLADGHRTPVFLIDGSGFTRWSFYLRLPTERTHALAGIVRCELPGVGTVNQAATRASLVAALLPTFASEPHKDPRAPQNLYPIAGLERELRRRLGDQVFIERALREAAARRR